MNPLPIKIPTNKLQAHHVPKQDASWYEIGDFALSFSIREMKGIDVSELNIETVDEKFTLKELRYILYFEQRRWNHIGRKPTDDVLTNIKSVIRLIHQRFEDY